MSHRHASSENQGKVYQFVRDHFQRFGQSPTLKEIAAGIGVTSLATVHKHVSNLIKAGKLERDHGAQRGIRVRNVCPSCGRRLPRRKKAA